ncbi:MAG: thymidine kinase [Gammaproteobacteria bacterium RIFCSPHIGHO2_12_FULL_40_19]|nr:MAG: thymidine kinase [Gammaproteobacteria bacterium RIFCSPHIGHO2_12_FULL_40_19]
MAKLHFYYSAMNAGKSTTLLQSSYNYNERGMDTLLFTPIIDDRFGVGKITTRIGLQNDAIAIDIHFDIFSSVKKHISENLNIKCVLIDEAQFLTKQQVEQLTFVADFLNIPVLTYGIRTDFRGEPFEGSTYLLATADSLIELKTICFCGKKAMMNTRIDENGEVITDGEQIQIGGNERYVATCRKHFRLKQTGLKKKCEAVLIS